MHTHQQVKTNKTAKEILRAAFTPVGSADKKIPIEAAQIRFLLHQTNKERQKQQLPPINCIVVTSEHEFENQLRKMRATVQESKKLPENKPNVEPYTAMIIVAFGGHFDMVNFNLWQGKIEAIELDSIEPAYFAHLVTYCLKSTDSFYTVVGLPENGCLQKSSSGCTHLSFYNTVNFFQDKQTISVIREHAIPAETFEGRAKVPSFSVNFACLPVKYIEYAQSRNFVAEYSILRCEFLAAKKALCILNNFNVLENFIKNASNQNNQQEQSIVEESLLQMRQIAIQKEKIKEKIKGCVSATKIKKESFKSLLDQLEKNKEKLDRQIQSYKDSAENFREFKDEDNAKLMDKAISGFEKDKQDLQDIYNQDETNIADEMLQLDDKIQSLEKEIKDLDKELEKNAVVVAGFIKKTDAPTKDNKCDEIKRTLTDLDEEITLTRKVCEEKCSFIEKNTTSNNFACELLVGQWHNELCKKYRDVIEQYSEEELEAIISDKNQVLQYPQENMKLEAETASTEGKKWQEIAEKHGLKPSEGAQKDVSSVPVEQLQEAPKDDVASQQPGSNEQSNTLQNRH